MRVGKDEEAVVVPEVPLKNFTRKQFDMLVRVISDFWRSPADAVGYRRNLVAGLAGFLAYLGYRQEAVEELVIEVWRRTGVGDPEEVGTWLAGIRTVYVQAEKRKPVPYRRWLRRAGIDLEMLEAKILSAIRPKISELKGRKIEQRMKISMRTHREGLLVRETLWVFGGACSSLEKKEYVLKPNGKSKILKQEHIKGAELPVKRVVRVRVIEQDGRNDKDFLIVETKNGVLKGSLFDVAKRLAKMTDSKITPVKMWLSWYVHGLALAEEHYIFNFVGIAREGETFKVALPELEFLQDISEYARVFMEEIEKMTPKDLGSAYEDFLATMAKYRKVLGESVYYLVMSYMAVAPFLPVVQDIVRPQFALVLLGDKCTKQVLRDLGRFITINAYGGVLRRDIIARVLKRNLWSEIINISSATTLPLFLEDLDIKEIHILSHLFNPLVIYVDNKSKYQKLELSCPHIILPLQRTPLKTTKLQLGNVTCAKKFLSELVDVANTLGGVELFRKEFPKGLEEGQNKGIRRHEFYAILRLGALLLSVLLPRHGYKFPYERAVKAIEIELKRIEKEMLMN